MTKVICDRKTIYNRTGMDVVGRTITGNLFRDCYIKTFMIKTDDEKIYIVGDNLDRGDIEYMAKNVDKMFFASTYLTYSGGNGKCKDDEYTGYLDAFKAAIPNDETIVLPGALAVDTYYDLINIYDVQNDFTDTPSKKYYVYSKKIDTVLDQIHENDDCINQKAYELILEEENRKILKPYIFEQKDNRFSNLISYMNESGLSGIILSSALNIQEVSGLNFDELREKEVYGYYNKGEDKVYVISEGKLVFNNNLALERYNVSLIEAFYALNQNGKIGVEEANFMISRYLELELDKKESIFITKKLREWREARSGEDLPYYIIAAKLTAYAIDGAKAWAEKKYYNDERFTENEIFAEYERLKEKYIIDNNIPVVLENYDPCTYSSDRSEYPCTNTEFMIPRSAGSVRLDNGELVKDKYGYVHAASDICRTACFNPVVRKVSDILLDIMRNEIIPNIHPGMMFSEIWELGTAPIFEKQNILKEIDMIPERTDLAALYKRNIGHGMAKQTRTANFITESNHNILLPGSVGNIELPFNFRKNMAAVEDMWFCTDEGTVNITTG